jgi:transposase
MDKVFVRRISPPERRVLQWMKRQMSNAVNQRHARIILLSCGRVRNREIAERVGCSPQWVRKIIHRFNEGGIEAIEWYPWLHVSSQPRKFLSEILEEIGAIALSPPQQLIDMCQWSLSKLRSYLIAQQIISDISIEWLRTILHRLRIRWRRTKTWKESQDPDFREKYKRLRTLYAARPYGGRRICVDEFGPLNLQPRHGGCWAGPGKRVGRLRATYHRTGGIRHFFAAYDLETDRLYGVFKSRKTWCDFLDFLKIIRRRYRSREVLHIVLDNYKPHIKREVLDWAASHGIRFYYTPTNASWLNRIECEFTEMKKFSLENSDYRTHEEQQRAIQTYLDWRNGKRNIAVAPWTSTYMGHAA